LFAGVGGRTAEAPATKSSIGWRFLARAHPLVTKLPGLTPLFKLFIPDTPDAQPSRDSPKLFGGAMPNPRLRGSRLRAPASVPPASRLNRSSLPALPGKPILAGEGMVAGERCLADSALDLQIAARRDEWTKLFQELVRIPSVFEAEHEAVDLVEARLGALGVECASVPFDPDLLERLPTAQRPISTVRGRRNLVARLRGSGGGRSLALNCHLDVVPAVDVSEWRFEPFAGHVDEGCIYGRGTYDDKAGVVIALALLETLVSSDAPRRGDLLVHIVLEDETSGNGTLLCLEAGHRADAGIILDGTRFEKGIDRHAGNCQFRVSVKGRPASVSVSHVGTNAAEMLMMLLMEMRQAIFARNAANEAPWTRFPSPNQFVVQSLHSLGETLTVPTSASAQAYVTFTPPAQLADIRAQLNGLAEEFTSRNDLPEPPVLDWSGFATQPVISQAAEISAAINDAACDLGMPYIDFGPSTGTSDMRHFVDKDIPCVLYGPGNGFMPHRTDEHYFLDGIPTMVRLLDRTVERWCNG
jgi:acetylornithine deacetylase